MKLITLMEDMPPELRLSKRELDVLKRAMNICEKADRLIRPGGDREADYTPFAYAAGDLSEIVLIEARGEPK